VARVAGLEKGRVAPTTNITRRQVDSSLASLHGRVGGVAGIGLAGVDPQLRGATGA
jgi:hypothetical protein